MLYEWVRSYTSSTSTQFKKDPNSTGNNQKVSSAEKSSSLEQQKSTESNPPNTQLAKLSKSTSNFNCFHQVFEQGVYFKIVPVILYYNGKSVEIYAYLDDGSEVTMLEDEIAKELGIVGIPSSLCLSWTDNYTRHETSSRIISLHISGQHSGSKKYYMPVVRTVGNLGLPTQTIKKSELTAKYPYLKNAPFPEMDQARPRILIGLNYAKLKLPRVTIESDKDNSENPIAIKTRLGWLVYGQNEVASARNAVLQHKIEVCSCNDNEENDVQLHQLVKQYFSLENFGISPTVKPLESKDIERAKMIMEQSTLRKNGRFETGLLWKVDPSLIKLPDSYPMAKKRLECLEKKLSSNPALLENMNQQIKEFINKGYIRKLSKKEINNKYPHTWYLPMFVALHPKKPNKVRMVWDGAAKVKGVSLNSMLLSGPDLLSPLIDILRRFRERKIAICGDIREMFHQIMVKEFDQQSQRFLWRNGAKNTEPQEYVMQVLTFGSTSSPSSAQYIKNLNAKEFSNEYPRAAFAITENHHVDDLLDSVDKICEAIQLVKDVRYIHQQGGFEIRNFLSNSKEVLTAIGENNNEGTKDLNICKDSEFEKILGMWWNTQNNEKDYFTYSLKFTKINKEVSDCVRAPTKREVLKTLMSIYDPLGYLAHFLVYIKILLQDIWREKLNWDEPIPKELNERWMNWINVLPMVEEVKIPRHYSSKLSANNEVSIELHTFVDASINAYCAVSYFRIEDKNGVECVLIGAKTKVAPQKPTSIPRLELLATVLGSRLTSSLSNSHTVKIDKTYMWSDSMDALAWLHSDHRKFRQFVAFRVGEVLELTDISWWNYVPGKLNVADEGTKWQKNPSFEQDSRWFRGPDFLWHSKNQWPKQTQEKPMTTSEIKIHFLHNIINQPTSIVPERFSRWCRFLRAQAYVYRSIEIFKAKIKKQQPSHLLTQEDLFRAENVIYRLAQYDGFAEEIVTIKRNQTSENPIVKLEKSSSLFNCSPYLDENGVLRVFGRIDKAIGIRFDAKRPIILPKKHYITYLVVDHYHQTFLHKNNETVLNELRQKFHIPKLRVVLKRVITKCQKCKNNRAKPQPPIMAVLPLARLAHHTAPFTHTGVDFFGPMYIVDGRRKQKRWGVLFTCLTVRAIHIEIAHSLTTSSCIKCLRNFMVLQGTPIEIYSDNGSNLRGADNDLKKELKKLDMGKLSLEFIGPKLKWNFNPPSSPHMGGSWERLIRSVKSNLKYVMPTRTPTDEVLRNLLMEVMNIINSRPLTYVALESIDDEPLTPNHFLLGSSNGLKSPGSFPADSKELLKGWKYAQLLTNRFWRQWIRTYLPTLTRRTKWFTNVKPLEVGDVVIIVSEKNPRNYWPKAIVVETRPDKKGNVRSAVVQLVKGERKKLQTRPVSKLAKLDIYKEYIHKNYSFYLN